jgi:serine protease AprX
MNQQVRTVEQQVDHSGAAPRYPDVTLRGGRDDWARSQPRFKVRFSGEAFDAARAIEAPPELDIPVENEKRAFISVTVAPKAIGSGTAENRLEAQLAMYHREYGAEVVEDYQYALETAGAEDDFLLPVRSEEESLEAEGSLDDVLQAIKAPEAWDRTRGQDVVVAVVDTGIDGSRPEFPAGKRRGQWAPLDQDAWRDYRGHGTMCACIAVATRSHGGEFDGVAPDAGLISCRTRFFDSELATIYDYLIDRVEQDEMLVVVTNSFGIRTGSPPPPPEDSDFVPALEEAIGKGIKVFFSAGNNHVLVKGKPDECHPNSIWSHKCREDVMVAATNNLNGEMRDYSSRGPGQFYGQPGCNSKPDVTAPTPANGRILYGSAIRVLPKGWGTSGASPQVAGLAALLLSLDDSLTRSQLFDHIRTTARSLGNGATCEGSGQIDCAAAVSVV